jgi:3-phenylpropionate/trans-cinnamate dioxygenase ferredoxin subunit
MSATDRVVALCREADLAVGEARRFEVVGTPVCLVRLPDGFRAISDTCSHEDFALSEGEVDVEECLIECWKHGSMFSLQTGEPVTFPATEAVAVFEVVVTDGTVSVVLP